jgi:hypothetical protein
MSARVAFFRRKDENSKAEVWVVNVKTARRKKMADVVSGLTLLFSLNSRHIYVQELPKNAEEESKIYSVSLWGGKPKLVGRARMLETILDNGPYRGDMVVFKTVKHHLGITAEDCAFVMTPGGKLLGRIKTGPCR